MNLEALEMKESKPNFLFPHKMLKASLIEQIYKCKHPSNLCRAFQNVKMHDWTLEDEFSLYTEDWVYY